MSWTLTGLVIGAVLSLTGLPTAATAQNGYAVQGPYSAASMAPSRSSTAYQQQGVPAAGSGLGGQPMYAPQPAASTPRARYTTPTAYQQRPAPQPASYATNPGYGQPHPYPAGAVQAPAYQVPTKKKTSPYKPVSSSYPGSSQTSQMANDISDLKLSDRKQDHRLAVLESRLGTGKGIANDDGYTTHTVRSSDTLWRIADKYGSTPTQIKAANHMTSDVVLEGQTLVIPGKRQAVANNPKYVVNPPSKSGAHTVQHGETLSGIAASYGVSLASLQSANGIRNADTIQLNQRLTIPGRSTRSSKAVPSRSTAKKTTPKASATPRYVSTPKPTTETVAFAPSTDFTGAISQPQGQRGITSYRIEQGDTWDTVAHSFNTSAADVRSMNKMESSNLPATGSEIIVPSPGPVSL